MSKNTTPTAEATPKRRGSAAQSHAAQMSDAIKLVEIRPGLFLNPDHIVSVRMLPQEEGGVYALMQLSNGDKLNLSREEFSSVTGEEPRQLARQAQTPGTTPLEKH